MQIEIFLVCVYVGDSEVWNTACEMAACASEPPDCNNSHSDAKCRDADATDGSSQRECCVA